MTLIARQPMPRLGSRALPTSALLVLRGGGSVQGAMTLIARQPMPRLGSRALATSALLVLRGGGSVDMSVQSYEWTVNIATPATLVAGAALATLLEGGLSEGLMLRRRDSYWVRSIKKLCLLLLMLAFSGEICVVFMSTVLGTVLLTGGNHDLSVGGARWRAFDPIGDSAVGMLHREMEFEYLAISIGFVNGLMWWLLAIGLRFVVTHAEHSERERERAACRDTADTVSEEDHIHSDFLLKGMALSSFSLVLFLLSFYNQHLDFNGTSAGLERATALPWCGCCCCCCSAVTASLASAHVSRVRVPHGRQLLANGAPAARALLWQVHDACHVELAAAASPDLHAALGNRRGLLLCAVVLQEPVRVIGRGGQSSNSTSGTGRPSDLW
jgi:hypothetical protein